MTAPFIDPTQMNADSLLTHSQVLQRALQHLRQLGAQDGLEHQAVLYRGAAGDSAVVLPDSLPAPNHITPYFVPPPNGYAPIARMHVHPWEGYQIPAGMFPNLPQGGMPVPGPSPDDRNVAKTEGLPQFVVDGQDSGNVWEALTNGRLMHRAISSVLQNLGIGAPKVAPQ